MSRSRRQSISTDSQYGQAKLYLKKVNKRYLQEFVSRYAASRRSDSGPINASNIVNLVLDELRRAGVRPGRNADLEVLRRQLQKRLRGLRC